MPANNGAPPPESQGARSKRIASRVVVPAIPLALTKPQSARPPPKPDTIARASSGPVGSVEKVGVSGSVGADLKTVAVAASPTGEANQAKLLDLASASEDGNTMRHADTPVEQGSTAVSVSGEASPGRSSGENKSQPTPPPTENPETFDPATVASVTSPTSRKDRFDMRQIRTELPPAFVPSAELHTPQSAQSAASSQSRQPFLPHGHPARPSANNIIFGGHDSSASSPAPQQSSGSAYPAPQYPPHSSFPNHAHNPSDPNAQRMFQAAYPQPQGPWGMRSGFPPSTPQPYYHPHAHMPFRYPPPVAPLANGHATRSRSGSPASSAAPDGQKVTQDLQSPVASDQLDGIRQMQPEPKAAFPQHRHLHSQQMPPPPANFQHLDLTTNLENAESIREYLLGHFQNPEFADCHLQVVEQASDSRQYLECHRMVLARSPTLLSIIRNSEAPTSTTIKTQLHVQLKGKYVRVNPFAESVRYLYGGPLPRIDLFNSVANEERIEPALEFIATGAWLGIAAIAHRGVEMAGGFLHWDTISAALAFALDGGLGQAWPIEDGSEERVSTCSSDDSFSRPESGGAPTHDPYSTGLLHRTIDFIVHNLPPNFYLDPAAPQLASCPRLPTRPLSHESKPSRSDPRLSKIRFGEVPVEDHQRPSLVTTTISSVLLSLPFPLLKYLLEHPLLSGRLGSETVSSIMRQVVNEREVRRQKALKARPVSGADEVTQVQQVQNLYWEESVEQSTQHRAGFRLARRRRGIDTPPSSGTESERAK